MGTGTSLIGRINDMSNLKFNRLTVLSFNGRINGHSYWECLCDCGNKTIVEGYNIRNGITKSCGCYAVERLKQRGKYAVLPDMKTHGLSNSKLYAVWSTMKARCLNKNNHAYSRYGGRGIKVCDRWLHSFENFFADMSGSYKDGLTLERKNVNGNYEYENCKWATYKEQARNTRSNIRFVQDGKEITLAQYCEDNNIKLGLVHRRLRDGWDLKDAISKPIFENKITFANRK